MNNAKLLLVSNSAEVTCLVQEMLNNSNVNMACANSMKQAQTAMLPHTELILLDYALGRDEATVAVKTGIPTMFLVHDESPKTVNEVYGLGACDFVVVPSMIDNLFIARVKSQLGLAKGKRKLEKANDDLYEFCMPASHDLKAPFTVISMFMDVMQEELKELENEKLNKLVSAIGLNAMQIKTMIEDHYRHAQAESCHRGGYLRTVRDV